MRSLLCLLFAALLAAQSFAAEFQAIVRAGPGSYVLTVAADGSFQVEATPVVTPGGTPVPPPLPPPDPNLRPDAKAVAAAAAKVKDPDLYVTAANLAAGTAKIQDLLDQNTITGYVQTSKALAVMWDGLIPRKQRDAWEPVRTIVMDRLAALAQQGAADDVFSAYLADVDAGLTSIIPADAPRQLDWDKIMQLLEFFVKYILPLIIGA